jgi:pimeloyl-ACP methyl ester carboxylesterase
MMHGMSTERTDTLNKDLQGISQLTGDGINGVVDLVEAMHQRIASLGGALNTGDLNRTSGISGFVYRRIRQTTRLITDGLGFALSAVPYWKTTVDCSPTRQQWLAILNGVMGDHLQHTDNPLAIPMSLQHAQQAISTQQAALLSCAENNQPLLLIHGLCMNDSLWRRHGHDHGQALQQDAGMSPVYLRYNSGLAVYQNGQQLAAVLQQYFAHLPDDKQLHVLCHSMGGLVMRSAMHLAEQAGEDWPERLGKVVFLGTPHQGAVLEKTGNLIDYLLSINPYTAPFAKLGHVRSHGIKNLRHGTITPDHQTIQLPACVAGYALAASTPVEGHQWHQKWIGDGLVSVDSALGGHRHPEREVLFRASHKHTFNQVSHMGLLSDPRVYQTIKQILTR